MVQVGSGIHDAPRNEDTPNLLPVVEPQGETLGAGTNHVERTHDPHPLREGSRRLELLRRRMTSGLMTAGGYVWTCRVESDILECAVEDVLEADEVAEQALVEAVAVLVVGGDIPHDVTEQIEPGQARVGRVDQNSCCW